MTQHEAARAWLQHLNDWLNATPGTQASDEAQAAMNRLWLDFHLEDVKVSDVVLYRDAGTLARLAREMH